MANFASPITTYSDTTPQRREITNVISLIDPSDAPLVEALGGLDGAAGKFRFVNGPATVKEWLEDTLTPLTTTLVNAATIASADTTMLITDPNMVQEGHILLVDAEQMWVSAVAVSTSVITVTRNYGGTQATHDSVDAVTIIGMARLEGTDSDDIGYTDRTTNSNYTQIFHKEIKVSRTQSQIAQYGIANEFNYQANKAIPELMRLVERALFYGQRKAGSASTPRAFGGYSTFITNNKVSGATLAQSQFEAAIQSSYEDGGSGPWLAVCAPANLTKVKNFYDSSNFLRVDRTESTLGMVIESVLTPFGNVNLLLDRWALTTEIPLIDPKHAGFLTLQPFTQEPLAKTGDSQKGEVVGEFTFCLRQDKAHGLLTAVS
jgi:hypothetical protein